MADITQPNPKKFLELTDAYDLVLAKASVTAGNAVYRDSADGEWTPSKADNITTARCDGVAMTNASASESFIVAKPGAVIDLGALLTKGDTYYVSPNNAGGVVEEKTDLGAGHAVSRVGEARATGVFVVDPYLDDNVVL